MISNIKNFKHLFLTFQIIVYYFEPFMLPIFILLFMIAYPYLLSR